ncbi:MAG: F0F1 ATP synthase subunit A [Desulfatibacillaceae bacterium]|nr:F0F1 ATP synthase subunit A [Desulfatibacillaceae bacterium]
MVFNLDVILMTWISIALLLILGIFSVRKKSLVPHSVQVLGELFVRQFASLTEDALDKELGRKYAPMITALFMFLLVSNWLGAIPHMSEPTRDLNTPLSLGFMGFVIAHYAGIKAKGFRGYAREYFQPFPFMMPLNLIGEIAKVISISFRLFGNIMGGSIIVLVVSHLIFSLILPPFLVAFFSLFIGTIQAFVFTMLTIVYIAVQVK